LSPKTSRFWREITPRWDLRPDELRILEDACWEADLVDTLREAMDGEPLTVRGSQGQQVIHPIVSELRQHRSTLASLLKQLALPDDHVSAEAHPRSVGARAAAQARWRK
jgi:hypothetical protein